MVKSRPRQTRCCNCEQYEEFDQSKAPKQAQPNGQTQTIRISSVTNCGSLVRMTFVFVACHLVFPGITCLTNQDFAKSESYLI